VLLPRFTVRVPPDGTPRPSTFTPPSVTLRDSETQLDISIPGLRANQPHKTLGHWKSPAGPQHKQLQAVKAKAKSTSHLIATAPLPRQGAKLAYMAKYVAALRYVLPQCFFSHESLAKAEAQSTPAMIAKCGFCRKTAYAVLFAPTEMAGGGFVHHWAMIQSEGQIQHLIKHWRTSSNISNSLCIALAWSQWQSGIAAPILSDTHVSIHYIECRWLASLRDALRSTQSSVRLDKNFVQPPERSGDLHIMDVAQRSKRYSESALRLLNYCQLYLHVTTMSELLNSTGTKLLHHMKKCQRPPWFNPAIITVLQPRPTSRLRLKQWELFCKHLATLPAPGPWLQHRQLRLHRETYMTVAAPLQIYHWHLGCYWECILSDATRSQFALSQPTEWTPDKHAYPIQCTACICTSVYLQLPPHTPYLSPKTSSSTFNNS
jgi:hypothetical protein